MPATMNAVECPKCGGPCWDNRATKTNPRAPDYRCKDRECDGAIWPAKGNTRQQAPAPTQQKQPVNHGDLPGDLGDVDFQTLCTRYTECVGYVVKRIVPALTEKDIGVGSDVVASMAATLFIARTKAGV